MESYKKEGCQELSPTVYDFTRPCRTCDAAKVDAVCSPLLLYWVARMFGFQLCSCAG